MKHALLIILLASYFISSCSDPIDIEDNINKILVINDSLNTNGIKPLAYGNVWYYQVIEYDSTGLITDSYVFSDSVTADTIIDKSRWYRTSGFDDYWQSNHMDGLRFRKYQYPDPIIEWLEAAYPAEIKHSWQCNKSLRKIISTDTSISVTAGTFSCYYYDDILFNEKYSWEYSDIFFSPKIGLVLMKKFREKFNKERYLFQSSELITFIRRN